jgi:hypothetical protein
MNNNDSLYKYCSAETTIKVINNHSLRWSSPLLFNDPFDCDAPTIPNSSKLVEKCTNIFDKLGVDARYYLDELNNWCENLDYDKTMLDTTKASPNFQYLQKSLHDIAILCLTKSYENILMWSHYADYHKGAVLMFEPLKSADSVFLLASPVIYCEKKPRVDLNNINDFFTKAIYYKFKHWEYEQEYRIFMPDMCKENTYIDVKFNPLELRAVFFGCNINKKDKENIISCIENNKVFSHVKFHQAHKKFGFYSLSFELLE